VEKRLPMFLESFAWALKETGADAYFVIVGSGPEEAAVRAACDRLGLEGRVRLVAPTPSIERIYAAADAFVLPSVSEGLSNALLEAMSSGLAVFASRVGGTGEAVTDGVSGLLFEPMDQAGLRGRLTELLSSTGLAGRLGEAARKTAVEKYDIEKTAEEYVRLYEAEVKGS
jgi:glycosyltransferase involved in cell wall biosynthesis